jgi:hypothetical protein
MREIKNTCKIFVSESLKLRTESTTNRHKGSLISVFFFSQTDLDIQIFYLEDEKFIAFRGLGPLLGSYEHCNEALSSIKVEEFLDYVSKY